MTINVDYYLSLNSPWTFIGSAPLAEIAARNNVAVNVKPARFGPIFKCLPPSHFSKLIPKSFINEMEPEISYYGRSSIRV